MCLVVQEAASSMKKNTKHTLTLLTFLGLFGTWTALAPRTASAVELGDATRGLDYASRVCAECHLVDDQGPYSVNPDAPSFKEIANTAGMTGTAIKVWLQTSHPTMPDLIIPAQDTDDLIAYILSLRSKGVPRTAE